MKDESSSDPAVHSENIQRQLDELIRHAREDIAKVTQVCPAMEPQIAQMGTDSFGRPAFHLRHR